MLESIYNSLSFNQFADKGKQKTKHTTLSDRLNTMDHNFLKTIFERLYDKFKILLDKTLVDFSPMITIL
ncbi:MAG: hypothetical protein PHF46_02985 [Candidatus Gracilibacteria bacterium]|nr:hypothetical protein [Candidatus Gracilibacteria bacterium]MDD3120348.1 hypothetical protein [Candidatus Gracilibacteria bacterium]MDD4530350.1 hypothetical protein [Candidatus Gracilibacteria bacterium]